MKNGAGNNYNKKVKLRTIAGFWCYLTLPVLDIFLKCNLQYKTKHYPNSVSWPLPVGFFFSKF
jgi:hypothetical protein